MAEGVTIELCGYCRQPALGYARLSDGTRVCHHDTRSCYNACTYQGLRHLGPRIGASGPCPDCGRPSHYVSHDGRPGWYHDAIADMWECTDPQKAGA